MVAFYAVFGERRSFDTLRSIRSHDIAMWGQSLCDLERAVLVPLETVPQSFWIAIGVTDPRVAPSREYQQCVWWVDEPLQLVGLAGAIDNEHWWHLP